MYDEGEPPLAELVARLSEADLTIVEGYTRETLPRLEVVSAALGAEPLCKIDVAILAIAADTPAALDTTRSILPVDDIDMIGDYISQPL